MEKFINTLMGLISGVALMSLNILGKGIVDRISFNLTGGNIAANPLVDWGFVIIHLIILIISLIGMVLTIIFALSILKILIKSRRS